MKNIIIIGYRCTGKSSVGKKLAEILHRSFIDTDELIIKKTGRSILETIETDGWTYFRRIECEVVQELAAVTGSIIATGGGVLDDHGNRDILKTCGLCLWLTADAATIVTRLLCDGESTHSRPALSMHDITTETRAMLLKREPAYRAVADYVIDTQHRNIDETVENIRTILQANEVL